MQWSGVFSVTHPETLCVYYLHWLPLLLPYTRVGMGTPRQCFPGMKKISLSSVLRFPHPLVALTLIWEGRGKKQSPFSETIKNPTYLSTFPIIVASPPPPFRIFIQSGREREYLLFMKKWWFESSAFEKPKFKLLKLKIILFVLHFKRTLKKQKHQSLTFLSWTSTIATCPEDSNPRMFQLPRLWKS